MKNLLWMLLIAGICQAQQTGTIVSKSDYLLQQAEQAAGARRIAAQAAGIPSVASKNFDVSYYRCEWQVNPAVRYIRGNITSYFTITSATDTLGFDLSTALTVDSIKFRGLPVSFSRFAPDGLKVQLPSTLTSGQRDSLTIYYQGVPDSRGLGSFFQGYHRHAYAIWTLSEPYGAKDWWPCKIGLDDKADSIDIVITVPQQYTSSSNGLMISESIADTLKTNYFRHRYPIASYLVAIAITQYTVVRDSMMLGGREMPILTYTYPFAPTYYQPAVLIVKNCMNKFSELFGIYPFYQELYAQTAWGWGGGMEHQTNSFIVDRWPSLVTHELGHQWFGDKVTCGSWQDIWLNEGFATYSTNIYYEFFDPTIFKSTLVAINNYVTSEPGGSVWVRDTSNVARIFDGRLTYYKGSYVVHMLRGVLGDSLFFEGVRQYLNEPGLAYGYAKTEDLRRVLERVSGKNLSSFFQKWIYGEGYPNYHAEFSQNANNWVTVKLEQTTSHPSVGFYDMPVQLQLRGTNQSLTFTVDHRYSGQSFTFNPGFQVDSVLIDPDFWILSRTKTSEKVSSSSLLNEIKVYPNPVDDDYVYLSLLNPTDRNLLITLHNSLGQLVFKNDIETPGGNEIISVPIDKLPRGVYLLKLRSEKAINSVFRIVRR